jgi:hypothetical protein
MRRTRTWIAVLAVLGMLAVAAELLAQTPKPWGRVSFMADGTSASDNGSSLPGFTEVVGSFTFAAPYSTKDGADYRFDVRSAAYPSTDNRPSRTSIYDAYVGYRFAGGSWLVRGGQMWLNDLGGLGSIGGAMVEYSVKTAGVFQRLRFGAFGGAEPKVLDAGYVSNVVKAGGYVALERNGSWRNVVGFVTIRNSGLTERSVLTMTNLMPFGRRIFVYQAAEVDLTGPAGVGSGRLTYFFVNARVAASSRVELQGLYHRGRSIDTRTITLDQIKGRPVSARSLEGWLFESAEGRVTLTLGKGYRVFGGYGQDRSSSADAATDRITFGFLASDLLGTGLDVRVSDYRHNPPESSYDAWDASVGRNLTSHVYLTLDYASSLAVLQADSVGGYQVEQRPRTTRYALSALISLNRRVSLLLEGEHLRDGTLSQIRWLSGLTVRF